MSFMSAKFFVDTNVLVYARDVAILEKQAQTAAWMSYLWSTGSGRLSMQVITEFYWVITGKLKPGMEPARAREDIEDLLAWQPLPLTPELVMDAWLVQDLFHLSWWDSLIVSAARMQKCAYILSEDFQHAQDFQGVRVINPFRVKPEELERE
jgi:predicted nucleic acid-binding protein